MEVAKRDTGVDTITYSYGDTTVEPRTETHPITALQFRLLPNLTDDVVVNSVRFTLGGRTYDDANGTMISGANALPSGGIDYASGDCTLTFWDDGELIAPSVASLLARYGLWTAQEASFRSALAPLAPEGLQIVAVTESGDQITGSADEHGVIQGPKMRGEVNYQFGTAWVEFGALGPDPDWEDEGPAPPVWIPISVLPEATVYNAVAFKYIPLDADILGIDPVRLPPDGRVPIFRAGNIVLVMHPQNITGTPAWNVTTGDYRLTLGRMRIAWARVTDAAGVPVVSGYTLLRAEGILVWTSLAGLALPLTVRHTVADLRLITDAQISGQLTLARPLTHAYPAGESLVASCLLHGDRRARVSHLWDQHSWDGTWQDSPKGNAATATLNTIAYPVEVTNEGAETERWVLRWTNTTQVELIGQRVGLVYAGAFTADLAPINPRTRLPDGSGGVPYLRIPVAANSGGWATGNVVRINTVGAIADLWIARSIAQSDEPAGAGCDSVELYALGNIDRPAAECNA